MNKYLCVLVYIFSCICAGVSAEEYQQIHIFQAIDIATRNNPEIQSSWTDTELASIDTRAANRALNPQLILDNGFVEETHRFGVQQTFELGQKRKKRVEVANIQQQIAVLEYQRTRQEIYENVRQSYIDLYIAYQEKKLYEELHGSAENLYRIAVQREKAGDIAQLEVLQTQMLVAEAFSNLRLFEQNILEKKLSLEKNIGTRLNPLLHLESPQQWARDLEIRYLQKKNNSIEHLQSLGISQRTEMEILQLQQLQYEAEKKLSSALNIPDLSLTAGTSVLTTPGISNNTGLFISTSIEIPFHKKGQFGREKAQKMQVLNAQKTTIIQGQIENEIQMYYTNAQSAHLEIQKYQQQILPTAKEVLKKSQLSYSLGKSSIITPITAQQSYNQVHLNYLQAMRNYYSSISSLYKAVGDQS